MERNISNTSFIDVWSDNHGYGVSKLVCIGNIVGGNSKKPRTVTLGLNIAGELL